MTTPATLEGIYDMAEEEYHAHPALSVTAAKKLLPPSCPRLFRHDQDNKAPHKRTFDFGHAAHMVVLGAGPELHVVGADNYLTKAAKTERDEAYARGAVPLLPAEFDTVQAMASALREHPRAADLFTDEGLAEQSLFWTDPATGVPCRARTDWLSRNVVDYKTTTDVSPPAISRTVEKFFYHSQAAWYLDGAIHLDLIAEDAEFLFVFQDKNPPYLVTVVDLHEEDLQIGRERNRLAREIYRDCTEANIWPAYSNDIVRISLPAYARRRHHEGIFA
ncbi:PD-(D/E)XK nuclease-like domain-containing protein [Actinoplanes sp. CA-051413]|uniref:PD-(D/E)XK nuclease-like domain-containing protein n=1 Tax=Actinoplanes sp. CA-051413 TaxID=3239899 RepID=UPI003D98841B